MPYILICHLFISHPSHAQFKWLEAFQSPKDQTQAWRDYVRRNAENEAALKAERDKTNQLSIVLNEIARERLEFEYKYLRKDAIKTELAKSMSSTNRLCFDPSEEGGGDCDKCSRHRSHGDSTPWYLRPAPESSRSSIGNNQPDLSGLYYQRTIVGDNAGDWSIQFISGPN